MASRDQTVFARSLLTPPASPVDAWAWNADADEFIPAKQSLCLEALVPPTSSSLASVWLGPQGLFDASHWLGTQRLIDAQNDSIAFLCSQLHADRELDCDLSLQKLTSIEAQLQDCVAALASDRRGKHSSDVVASPDRRVKCVRSLSAVAPAPACSEDNKLEKANQIIVELRTRNASQSAMGARTAALNNHGRLLQTLRIPAGALDSSFPVAEVFLKFSGSATELDIQDPYLVSSWQLQNLESLLEALLSKSHVRMVRLSTHPRSQGNSAFFDDLVAELADKGLTFSVAFIPDLHLRELSYSNGIAIVPDRGLDIYKGTCSGGLRFCRNTTVLYYECDDNLVVRSANVAASVASEARSLITDGLAKDMLQINALIKSSADLRENMKEQRKEDETLKKVRRHLECKQIDEWLVSLGLVFDDVDGGLPGISNLGAEPNADMFIEGALSSGVDPFSPEGFQKQVTLYQRMGMMSKVAFVPRASRRRS